MDKNEELTLSLIRLEQRIMRIEDNLPHYHCIYCGRSINSYQYIDNGTWSVGVRVCEDCIRSKGREQIIKEQKNVK